MSHFTLVVVTNEKPTDEVLTKALEPYHEFECTGMDKYIQELDITTKVRDEYNKDERKMFMDTVGNLYEYYDERFLVKTPEGSTYVAPEGWHEVDVAAKSIESFAAYAADWTGTEIVGSDETPDIEGDHKYGWVKINEDESVTVIRRSNPNAKWDWWVVGGRWSNFFSEDGAIIASPDRIRKRDIKFDKIREKARREAAKDYDKVIGIVGDLSNFMTWDAVKERFKDNENVRHFYNGQPEIVKLREDRNLMWVDLDDYVVPRDTYIQRKVDGCLVPFAVLKDGQWMERGEMGWFGMSYNEVDRDTWHRQVNELYESLSDDTWLTIVDCHI